ncbi:actin cortical patch SUR7/pH-response regulator pali [Russula dissimulans]|nr:actin cortical patch SUR7/pH-response regulator pali [Russula dissimulans]
MLTLPSFAAVMLLIFVHIGQINTSSVPRGIAMAKMNVSQYGQALEKGLGDPITGLYATNASAPLQEEAGLRQEYKFGVYGYCGYLNDSVGVCSNTSVGKEYQPYNALLADMSLNYSALTAFIINGTSSFESPSIGSHTRSASYLIVIGTVCAFLAFVIGVFKHTLAFFASACLAMLATVFTLAAASLWTFAINTSESVNHLILNTTDIPLGIKVSSGSGLSLLWGAVGCLIASLVPYLISCCTFRG